MNSPQNVSCSHRDDESRLAELLDKLIERSRQGERIDYGEVVAAHPEFTEDLKSLWATIEIAEHCVSDLADDDLDAQQTALNYLSLKKDHRESSQEIAPAMPEWIGEYKVLAELGRGGMGVVYQCRQQSLDRVVALKMILRGELASPAEITRFRVESESVAKLNHPNIVSVYEVGEHDGQPWFSMQYLEGQSLSQLLAHGPLQAKRAAEIMLPICRAIAHAHHHGILHRDLKPANILLDEQGQPFVTDFGLAKKIITAKSFSHQPTQLTMSGAILGTPAYLAPELAAVNRGEVNQQSDVYSLGAILYALLTGRPPFQAATPLDTLLMVLEQDPLPPRLLNRNADPDLELIALKCLQKPADLRYNSADELAGDLEAYLKNEPITARSGHFTQVISRAFRETHHAGLLENWGLLWMWHSLVLLIVCLVTNGLYWNGVRARWPFLGLWTFGLGTWAVIFWNLRRRSGPITFVERQIAHAWAGSIVLSTLLFALEALLNLPVLSLSPVLALAAGMVFLVKAGVLTGLFYIQAVVLFATALLMAFTTRNKDVFPDIGISIFGIVAAACFFIPGWKYYQQQRRSQTKNDMHVP